MLLKSIISTFFFVFFVTLLLNNINNKSNFPKKFVIPFITAVLTKYIIGDWDIGYIWSYLDVIYWITIIIFSYLIIILN